jgi:hypothetical protein
MNWDDVRDRTLDSRMMMDSAMLPPRFANIRLHHRLLAAGSLLG